MPGARAGYHLTSGMTLLAEIVRRLDGRRFETYVRDEVFLPLGMADCWVGMTPDAIGGYGDRLGTMHSTATGVAIPLDRVRRTRVPAPVRARRWWPRPGAPARAPLRGLLGRGELDGRRMLLPQTVEALTARAPRRPLRRDVPRAARLGTGVLDRRFAMGRHASPRTFGHGGALSAISFADPEHGLVVVVQTNGMCGNDDHYLRLDAVTTALYEDLGLAAPGAPGRDKPFPSVELTVSTN